MRQLKMIFVEVENYLLRLKKVLLPGQLFGVKNLLFYLHNKNNLHKYTIWISILLEEFGGMIYLVEAVQLCSTNHFPINYTFVVFL